MWLAAAAPAPRAVLAAQYGDQGPQEVAEQLQLAALEQRVWDIMQDIKGLAGKLFLAEKLGRRGGAGRRYLLGGRCCGRSPIHPPILLSVCNSKPVKWASAPPTLSHMRRPLSHCFRPFLLPPARQATTSSAWRRGGGAPMPRRGPASPPLRARTQP